MKNNKAFANLLAAVEKTKNGTPATQSDQNFWKAETDKAGNGFATIRFLPGKTDDDTPFVKTYNHGFKSDLGKWYIESCPTTIGGQCPACEANGVLWNSGNEKDKDIVRQRKRRVSYIANVLVISDPKNPDNEGKVFLFKFGQKIFDKLVDKLQPQFEDEAPMNPFDPVEGANFKLKIRKVEGYSNFDKSEFESASEIENFDKVSKNLIDLNQFVDPSGFKSYDELKKKLDFVLGTSQARTAAPVDEDDDSKFVKAAATAANKKSSEVKKPVVEEDNDDMAYFQGLVDD